VGGPVRISCPNRVMKKAAISSGFLTRTAGIEPATFGSGDRRSIP
jgi:hypothetical protein